MDSITVLSWLQIGLFVLSRLNSESLFLDNKQIFCNESPFKTDKDKQTFSGCFEAIHKNHLSKFKALAAAILDQINLASIICGV